MDSSNQEKFASLFKKVMEVEEIKNDLSMNNMRQWDSLKHVELLTEIEEAFNIDIDLDDIMQMTSVDGILKVLSKYI